MNTCEGEGQAAVSAHGIKSASSVHEMAEKGLRAIAYGGRPSSSAGIQPDRPSHIIAVKLAHTASHIIACA